MTGIQGGALSQYQQQQELETAIRGILRDSDIERLRLEPSASADWAALQKICVALVRYSGYSLTPGIRTDPFDDPFVGAALITDGGSVLGSHRKAFHHEAHAEVETIKSALSRLRTPEATSLVLEIASGLERKSWLNGDGARRAFVDLFRKAGLAVRAGQKSPLIFLSTLEPCRDFETQPGCSELIVAFRPDIVLYACDDTNEKGQGRQVIAEAGIPLRTNIAVEQNLAANQLFYAAIHYLEQLIEGPEGSSFGLRYAIGQLSNLSPRHEIDPNSKRLRLRFEGSACLPIREAMIEPRAPFLGVAPDRNDLDHDGVLFLNDLRVSWMASYLEKYRLEVGAFPATIICSDGREDLVADSPKARYLKALEDIGVRIYTNVLRRKTELRLAVQTVTRWRTLNRADQIAAFAHGTQGYSRKDGHQDELFKWLDAGHLTRVNLIFDPTAGEELKRLLTYARDRFAFGANGSLAQTSFHLHVVANSPSAGSITQRELQDWLTNFGHVARFKVSVANVQRARASNARLFQSLSAGLLDPIAAVSNEVLESTGWRDRKNAGNFLAMAARNEPRVLRRRILDRLPTGGDPSRLVEEQWQLACSLLNAIETLGRTGTETEVAVVDRLLEFGETLEQAAANALIPPRGPLLDLIWRFTAATCATAPTGESVRQLLARPGITTVIRNSSFLSRELLFYAVRSRVAPEAIGLAATMIQDSALDPSFSISIGTRLARLAAVWPERLAAHLSFWRSEVLSAEGQVAFDHEGEHAKAIQRDGLPALFERDAEPQLLGTYLFLRTARSTHRRGLVAVMDDQVRHMLESPGVSTESLSWRGDKTALAQMVLSEVPPGSRVRLLKAIIGDEDETIRWAALVALMDRSLRADILQNSPGRAMALELRGELAGVIDGALDGSAHYWLHREFVHLFHREHTSHEPDSGIAADARFTLEDFPVARTLFAHDPIRKLHPEVGSALQAARVGTRRVLLILPPLTTETHRRSPVTASSTPALGLGSVGTYLASQGHDVALLDCHRFPHSSVRLADLARGVDVIGFGVVNSTYESTKSMLADLAAALRDERKPAIVLGGPAVTLGAGQILADRKFQFADYLIRGDGEVPMASLVAQLAHGTPPQIPGVTPIRSAGTVLSEPFRLDTKAWDALPWIDRRLFRGPDGTRYEPTMTRAQIARESHIVLSRGCDWHCSFCTEAIVRVSGETRRSPDDVVAEIEQLVHRDGASRFQFVDDNVFPQVAAPRPNPTDGETTAHAWVGEFLDGLIGLASRQANLGWRGIARFEDFLAYERRWQNFLPRLARSGCRLLAFGIEYGSYEVRKKAKGGTIPNQEIVDLIRRLDDVGIKTKGYFIIGGPGHNEDSTTETIEFALGSGLALAYFALYKNFRPFVTDLNRPSQRGTVTDRADQRAARFLVYEQMPSDFEAHVAKARTRSHQLASFGRNYPRGRIEKAQAAVSELRSLGFQFSDIFKYNDFHADFEAFSGVEEIWEGAGDRQKRFLQSVRRAYFEFYTRPAFVAMYRELVAGGY